MESLLAKSQQESRQHELDLMTLRKEKENLQNQVALLE
jgi:hypothetical protein